jgi:tetratricopeptide (TPR) repeat protein
VALAQLCRDATPEPDALTPRTRTLLVVAGIVVGGLLVLNRLGRMDRRFFGESRQSVRALAHYLAGDYAGAARFYREDLHRWGRRQLSERTGSWIALAAGDLERAEAQARLESRQAPTDPEPLLTLAETALARRDSPTALALAGRVRGLRRDDYDALLITAVAHARQGAHHTAIDALERALRYDRVERRGTVFLSVLEVTGELDDRAVEDRPHCLLAHLHRYLRIYDPSHARPAASYARRAIEHGDRIDDAHATLALLHVKGGRPTRALESFEQAVTVNPRNTAALLGVARHRGNRGDLAEEYRLIRAAVEADPDDRFVVGALHDFVVRKLGDYRYAQALAGAAVARNERDGEAWWRLGHVQTHLGHHRQALHSYQRAVAWLPPTPELEEAIGDTLAELDRDGDAQTAYRRAVVLDPFRPQPHLGLGLLHGKARRWPEAIREFEMVARLGGGLNPGLCEMYLEVGRSGDAARCVLVLLAAEPDNSQALVLLGQVRAAQRGASPVR